MTVVSYVLNMRSAIPAVVQVFCVLDPVELDWHESRLLTGLQVIRRTGMNPLAAHIQLCVAVLNEQVIPPYHLAESLRQQMVSHVNESQAGRESHGSGQGCEENSLMLAEPVASCQR